MRQLAGTLRFRVVGANRWDTDGLAATPLEDCLLPLQDRHFSFNGEPQAQAETIIAYACGSPLNDLHDGPIARCGASTHVICSDFDNFTNFCAANSRRVTLKCQP